ncbi:MAG: ABC transporter substrate-binding protein [Alphaproteobacteria bacterium]
MKKINWKSIVGWGVAALVVTGIIGTNMYQEHLKSLTDKRRVYAALPLTGVLAGAGQDYKKAMDAALSKIKNPQIELVYVDTEFKGDKSVSAVQQATFSDDNPLILSFATLTSNVLIPYMANQHHGFVMAGETIDLPMLKDYTNYQRFSVLSNESTQLVVDYVKNRYKDKVGVMYTNDPYGSSMANYFMDAMEKNNISAFKVSFENNSTDIRNEVLKLLLKHPDMKAIFVAGSATPAFINVFRQLKQQGFNGEILTSLSFAQKFVFDNLEDYANDVIFMSMEPHLDAPRTAKAKEFREFCLKNEMYPSFSSIEGYDMVNLINHMISNGLDLTQDNFLKLKEFDSVAGKVDFKTLGNATYSFILAKLKDGKIVPVTE